MRVFNAAKCRPRPEPAEAELREILEHQGADTAAPHHPADKGAAAE
jgi:hypothetical protein